MVVVAGGGVVVEWVGGGGDVDGSGVVLMVVVVVRWCRPYLSHNHTAGLCTGWWVVPTVVVVGWW